MSEQELNAKSDPDWERQASIRNCWFLTGATASGKSTVGLELAEKINAEIISLDSMAIYRRMDVGTAKPSLDDQAKVPHHLIDIVDANETYSVADYCADAWDAICEIQAKGKEVLFVGGTPLYLKSLLRGMFDGPPADWDIRREIEAEVEEFGLEELRRRLEMIDPLTAHKLHPNDKRRMIRALEVYRKTGQPISHLQREFDERLEPAKCRVVVLSWPRATLHQRIEERVNRMFEQGLVDEVRELLATYSDLSRTAEQAVGYREVIEHLKNDIATEETRQAVLVRTRQFARRQETWFRGLSECRWLKMTTDFEAANVANEVVELIQRTSTTE